MTEKPKLGTRAKFKPVDPVAAEAFLSGRNPIETAPAALPAPPPPPKPQPPRKVRRTTIIMGEELARRLAVYAAAHDTDQTTVIKDALEAWFDAHP